MKSRRQEEAVSPWELVHDEQALLHLEIAPEHKHKEEHHADLIPREEKPVVMHSLHPHEVKQEEKKQRKQSLDVLAKPKSNCHIQQYLSKLEEKVIQEKLKPHPEQKKLDIVIKPIAKNDITIHLPIEANQQHKITIERPIKHMPKSSKQSLFPTQRHEQRDLKGEMRDCDIKYHTRKHSMDNLHRNKQQYEIALKKNNQYEDQIIKKCALKNIQIYEGEGERQKEGEKKGQSEKKDGRKGKPQEKRHILDRILSKFE